MGLLQVLAFISLLTGCFPRRPSPQLPPLPSFLAWSCLKWSCPFLSSRSAPPLLSPGHSAALLGSPSGSAPIRLLDGAWRTLPFPVSSTPPQAPRTNRIPFLLRLLGIAIPQLATLPTNLVAPLLIFSLILRLTSLVSSYLPHPDLSIDFEASCIPYSSHSGDLGFPECKRMVSPSSLCSSIWPLIPETFTKYCRFGSSPNLGRLLFSMKPALQQMRGWRSGDNYPYVATL